MGCGFLVDASSGVLGGEDCGLFLRLEVAKGVLVVVLLVCGGKGWMREKSY